MTSAMLALDTPTIVLIIGIAVLCITSAITALGMPDIEVGVRRRRPRRDPAPDRIVADYGMHPPVMPRRVVTGRPASLPPSVASAPSTIELPTAPARHIDTVPDRPLTMADRAQAYIADLVDDDPQRMADLMLNWIHADDDIDRRDARPVTPPRRDLRSDVDAVADAVAEEPIR